MTYLFAQYWMFIALAFVLGLFVGYASCGGSAAGDWRDRWHGWAILAALALTFVAILKWIPGLAGHVLEVALLLFFAYITGCACGCAFSRAGDEDDATEKDDAPAPAAAENHAEIFGFDSLASYPGARPAALLAPRGGVADDLTRIAGLRPGAAKALGDIGVWHFDQIAAWGAPEVAWVEHHLSQTGLVGRENWVEQAGVLAAGDQPKADAGQGAGDSAASTSADESASASESTAASAPAGAPAKTAMTDGQRSILAAKEKMAQKAQRAASAPAAASAPVEEASAPLPVTAAPKALAPVASPGRAMTDGQRSILAARQKAEAKAAAKAAQPAAGSDGDYAGQRPAGLTAPRENAQPDDLKLIQGIGRQNEERLHQLGVWHFDQIAAWTPDNVKWVGAWLAFPGRIDRERWVEQAMHLARGETTEFARRAASGDVPTSKSDT